MAWFKRKATSPVMPVLNEQGFFGTGASSQSISSGRARDRARLFSSYDSQELAYPGRLTDGPPRDDCGENKEADEESNESETEGVKKQIRYTKPQSVNSTRNALGIAREAEEVASNTLAMLGDQSEKLANTERHLDISKGHANRVEVKQDELKQLNRSIFRPVIIFNKEGKLLAQEEKLLRRHEAERAERAKAMRDIRETRDRISKAQSHGFGNGGGDDDEGVGGDRGSGRFQTKRKERKRYQFEATPSDDELEGELDDNLSEIEVMAKKLRILGTAMGSELDDQNKRIRKLDDKTTDLDGILHKGIVRFDRIK